MDLNKNEKAAGFLTLIRIVVGWHFLYEGLAKLFNPGWSSAAFLMESKWLLAGFFHWLAADPGRLALTDFINTWGLILIGLALFLGIFTRISALAGSAMLLLFYIASPPFIESSIATASHFYIINYNVIEAVILIAIAALPADYLWGLGRLWAVFRARRKEKQFPSADNHERLEGVDTSRRELIKNLAVLPLFGGVFFGMARKRGWISFEEENLAPQADAVSSASLMSAKKIDIRELKEKVPAGTVGKVKMSRIMAGGNLISGFAHARDLIYVSPLLKTYFTDEKVIETLWLCEACGINTAVLRTDENTIRILEKYWKRGGKIQWLAQTYPKGQDITNIKTAVDKGAMGAFVMGNIADQAVFEKRMQDIVTPVEYIRSQGLIAGVAGHSITVPKSCRDTGLKVDFYMKTFHSNKYWSATETDPSDPYLPKDGRQHHEAHDNIWCMNDSEVAEFFRTDSTPWIAYKVLAAGAIKPEAGLRHAFSSGADFVCLGMFDFQVIENANIASSLLSSPLQRERQWYA
ncbi:MAG: DoxX family protein [Bacteroidales bacterium]|nr:DoxX family protein [Bacteroidales bacterium]